jgi:hypothetical protein
MYLNKNVVHMHVRNGSFIREMLQQMHDGAMRMMQMKECHYGKALYMVTGDA